MTATFPQRAAVPQSCLAFEVVPVARADSVAWMCRLAAAAALLRYDLENSPAEWKALNDVRARSSERWWSGGRASRAAREKHLVARLAENVANCQGGVFATPEKLVPAAFQSQIPDAAACLRAPFIDLLAMAHWENEVYAFFELATDGVLHPRALVVPNSTIAIHRYERILQPICFFRADFGFGLLLPEAPLATSSLDAWFKLPKDSLSPRGFHPQPRHSTTTTTSTTPSSQ
jgi:hypothetical protein